MALHVGRRRSRDELKTELRCRAVQRGGEPLVSGDDPRSGGEARTPRRERGFGSVDAVFREADAGREESLLPGVLQQEDRAPAGDPARERDVARDGFRGDRLDGRILDRLRLDAEGRGQLPAHIVVGLPRHLLGKLLRQEEVEREAPVGLCHLHDKRAGRERAVLDGERRRCARHFDSVRAQEVDENGEPRLVVLRLGQNHRVGRLGAALFHRVPSTPPEVAEQIGAIPRGVLESRENARLHVVRVVAQRPAERLLRRRQRAIPLGLGDVFAGVFVAVGVQPPLDRLGGRVAERLVSAADRIVVRRHGVSVELRPALREAPGPDPGHSERGQRRHFVHREGLDLDRCDGIHVRVVRAGSRPDGQERNRLVQVVHDGGMPHEEGVLCGARQGQFPLNAVAVVVVEDIGAPVRWRVGRQLVEVRVPLEDAIEPVHFAVAAVGLGHGVDQDDDSFPDLTNVRSRYASSMSISGLPVSDECRPPCSM